MLSLPIFAFAGTSDVSDFKHVSLAGYGQHEIQICFKDKTKEIKSSQLQSFLSKGATLGKCLKEKKDDKEDKDDKKGDKKDDNKSKSNDNKSNESKVTVVENKKK
jgi:hypothetical protein